MRKYTVKILTIAYSSLKSTKMLRSVSVELGSSKLHPNGSFYDSTWVCGPNLEGLFDWSARSYVGCTDLT
jgi:hypothetical protein